MGKIITRAFTAFTVNMFKRSIISFNDAILYQYFILFFYDFLSFEIRILLFVSAKFIIFLDYLIIYVYIFS